jgi:hypothetical protein
MKFTQAELANMLDATTSKLDDELRMAYVGEEFDERLKRIEKLIHLRRKLQKQLDY